MTTDEELQGKIKEEGDFRQWVHRGLKCYVWRHESLGHLNGYVAVPEGSRLYGKGYSHALCGHDGCRLHSIESLIDVHGGVTFAGKAYFAPGEWLVGFDTGHLGDLCPYADTNGLYGVYRDMEYVVKETEKLADQILKLSARRIFRKW